jgi:dolichol-phosphate mannosyltransferase
MIHILLLAYNEGRAIGSVLEGVARTLADGNYRVWVVDEGSSDNTVEVVRSWVGRIPVTLIQQGQVQGFQTGLSAEDVLVTLNADNTHPPQLIPRLVQPLEENHADIAIASRFVTGGQTVGVSLFHRFLSQVARFFWARLFPIPGVGDYTSGFRAYRGDLLRRSQILTENGFISGVKGLLRLSVLCPRVVEVPLVLRYDRKQSKPKLVKLFSP